MLYIIATSILVANLQGWLVGWSLTTLSTQCRSYRRFTRRTCGSWLTLGVLSPIIPLQFLMSFLLVSHAAVSKPALREVQSTDSN